MPRFDGAAPRNGAGGGRGGRGNGARWDRVAAEDAFGNMEELPLPGNVLAQVRILPFRVYLAPISEFLGKREAAQGRCWGLRGGQSLVKRSSFY